MGHLFSLRASLGPWPHAAVPEPQLWPGGGISPARRSGLPSWSGRNGEGHVREHPTCGSHGDLCPCKQTSGGRRASGPKGPTGLNGNKEHSSPSPGTYTAPSTARSTLQFSLFEASQELRKGSVLLLLPRGPDEGGPRPPC